MKQSKFQLKNKLNVLLIESKKSPVVSVQMWVKTGSADEKNGEEGISHFIEHLVFKGTEKFKVGEIANLVEASGGELNAYTSFDQTVFYVTISKTFQDVALDVVSQMMGHPTFDPDEVHSEREVVCEEIKMGQDSPGRKSSQLVFSSAFKKHAYGIPVIGYDKNVRSWPVKKIKSFYQSRYVPSNMFLVVSGDFETKEMKQKVENYFNGFKPLKLRKVSRKKEPTQKTPTVKTLKFDIQDRHLHFAFKAPNVKHKDVPALDVLAMVLGQGDSSLLVKKLRLDEPVVSSVSAYSYNPVDQGLFVISAHYQENKFDRVANEILTQINFVRNHLIDWAQIKRARVAISSEQFYSVETVEGIANKAGSLEFYFKDQTAQKKYLKALNLVTPEALQKVAKKYLNLATLNLAFMGNIEEAESKKLLNNVIQLWPTYVKNEKVKPQKNKKLAIPNLTLKPTKLQSDRDVERITLDSGIKILFKEIKDTPTVSSKLVFRGGARLETVDTMGLCELTARTWIGNTKDRSEAEVFQEIEEYGIGLSSFSGKNTAGFSLDYLSAFEDKALDLAFDCIQNSEASSEIIEREKNVLSQQIKSKEDHPSSLCMRQFLNRMFPNHPLSFESTGTSQSIQKIDQTHLRSLQNEILNPKTMIVSVVGDFNKKSWLQKIKAFEKKYQKNAVEQPRHKVESIDHKIRDYLKKDKEQSHVIIGWRGLSFTDPERFALHAMEAILAGQGGRLFLELRDKNSLAYSVSPMRMESLETGYFGGYIACSPEKVDKAIELFKIEFNKLMDSKVADEELVRAQRYLIGQHDIGLQRKSALCNLIAFDEVYGNDFQRSLNISKDYMQVTTEQIQNLAQRLFTQPEIISIVGKETN